MEWEHIRKCAVDFTKKRIGQDGFIDAGRSLKLSDMVFEFYVEMEVLKKKLENRGEPVLVNESHSIYNLLTNDREYKCPTCEGYLLKQGQTLCECGQNLTWRES